jgi:alpha-tubulin suppressor-like RCC1 family protein
MKNIAGSIRRNILSRLIFTTGLVLMLVLPANAAGLGQSDKSTAAATISLASGNSHTCALVDGYVRCWGYALSVGAPLTTDRPVPVAVSSLPAGIQQISASGGAHTCALTPTGGVKCWGKNEAGQIGDGTQSSQQTPVDVNGLGGTAQTIGLGYSHSCAVMTSSGTVRCWGLNANYQLGADVGNHSVVPVTVDGLSGVKKVVGGGAHTCALLTSGALKCWGYNYYGSLGNGQSGNTADTYIPQNVVGLDHGVTDVAAGYLSTCAMLDSGQVKCWGVFGALSSVTPAAMAGLESGVTGLGLGGDHLCTLHTGGQVRCLGANDSGQLGDGTNIGRSSPAVVPGLESGVTSLAAGINHTCAATTGGQVLCWGNDAYSQLGIGTTTSSSQPWTVVALSGQTISGMSNGSIYGCAYTSGGALYCWGLSNSGNLGVQGAADFVEYPLPMAVTNISSGTTHVSAGTHTCAVVNGAAKCWGRNDVGQLGNGTNDTAYTPAQVSGLTSGVSKVAVTPIAGQAHTCAIVNGGAMCWGGNYAGQLGNDQTGIINGVNTPQAVYGLSSGVTDIASGDAHSCAVVNGAAMCWGSAYYGQVGNGVMHSAGVPNPKYQTPQAVNDLTSGVTAITTGGDFSCAVVNGAAKCWGHNTSGQLGNGGTTDQPTPIQVSGLDNGVTAISAGDKRACAVKSGEVWCWGGKTEGTGSTPTKVAGLSSVTKVSANYASCALNTQGLACWGNDQYGQLGDGRGYQSRKAVPVLGFGTQPEVRINTALAAPGSPLRLVGAKFPANSAITLRSNGATFCTLTSNADGFFPAVILTGGGTSGYYDISASSGASTAGARFGLITGGPQRLMEGGGPTCTLPGNGLAWIERFLPVIRK